MMFIMVFEIEPAYPNSRGIRDICGMPHIFAHVLRVNVMGEYLMKRRIMPTHFLADTEIKHSLCGRS